MITDQNPIGCTRAIAEYVARTQFADLPRAAVATTKLHILDALGIMLGAYGTRHALIRGLIELTLEQSARGQATIIGAGEKVGCADATMVNSVLANFLDFSDGHFMGGHINDRLVPPALATAERANASGRDLLTAVVLGYEVYIDLANAFFKNVEPVSVKLPLFVMLGPLAGVVPPAKLLGLSEEQITGALGLAASLQIGGAQYVKSGGHEKDLTAGHESRRALLSVLAAQKGIFGSQNILEGERGVLNALGAAPNPALLLGKEYRIGECYFKPYPACRYLHASIEAAMNLVREHGIAAADIERAIVTTNRSSAGRLTYEIKSHVNAIFSHAYQVATVLMDGKPSLPVAWQEKVGNPAFQDLLSRIEVRADPKYEKQFEHRSVHQPPWPAELQVHLRDGRRFASEVLSPKGDPDNPMSPTEVKEKFVRLATTVISESKAHEIARLIERLEEVSHVGDLMQLLVVK